MTKYICPHCGAECYSASNNPKCWRCFKPMKPESEICDRCTSHPGCCDVCTDHSEYKEDDGK